MDQLPINLDFLQQLDPPNSYPPNQDDLLSQIENKFTKQCQSFLSTERPLYLNSKLIESNLQSILKQSTTISQNASKFGNKLQQLENDLQKNNNNQQKLENRSRMLEMICELIKMEEIRKELQLEGERGIGQEKKTEKVIDQKLYLIKMESLRSTVEEAQQMSHLKEDLALVSDIIDELESIYQLAAKKVMRQLLTPKMVQLILSSHYSMFLQGPNRNEFQSAMQSNRLQHFKVSLYPMVNNLNYAHNQAELYQSILNRWFQLIEEDLLLFGQCEREDLVEVVSRQMMAQLIPKMEKNIYRNKNILELVTIRQSYHQFLINLSRLSWPNNPSFEILDNTISKCQILIQSKLSQQAQKLQSSKYNIYSIVSYIPIRQHLQRIKICRKHELEQQKIDWQFPFYSLATSRDPKNYPNNKSLIIFNLNIWNLYHKILPQGKHAKESIQLLEWCRDIFVDINIKETQRIYPQSFDKLMDLCGNFANFKGVLYAEVNLLGVEELRREIVHLIGQKYRQVYQQMLTKLETKPMDHQQIKEFCHTHKINLNKFGKHASEICIHSPQKLIELLQYE